jgi:hypothetical protein
MSQHFIVSVIARFLDSWSDVDDWSPWESQFSGNNHDEAYFSCRLRSSPGIAEANVLQRPRTGHFPQLSFYRRYVHSTFDSPFPSQMPRDQRLLLFTKRTNRHMPSAAL